MNNSVALCAIIAAQSAAASFLASFANTNAGGKLYISPVPQQNDLNRAGFEAITDWLEVKSMGEHGETGSDTNILSYDTWGTDVIQKAKGITDAGSPEIEVARVPTDPGQIAFRYAASVNFNFAFKLVKNDPASPGGTGTTIYNRGLVTGPKRPMGRNEDFDLEVFTLALNQREVVVDPTSGGAGPVNTAIPTITGTPRVGVELTASTGTFTGDPTITYVYQWFAGGVPVQGAVLNKFTPTTQELGKIIQVRVTATNGAGSASAMSQATAVVAAA